MSKITPCSPLSQQLIRRILDNDMHVVHASYTLQADKVLEESYLLSAFRAQRLSKIGGDEVFDQSSRSGYNIATFIIDSDRNLAPNHKVHYTLREAQGPVVDQNSIHSRLVAQKGCLTCARRAAPPPIA